MNRIQHLVDPYSTAALLEAEPHVEQGQYRTEFDGVPHGIFTPMHYEPNYAYPLIVWLHGPGGDERQLSRVMPMVSMRNYAAVGPRGTLAGSEEAGCGGYAWAQTEDHIYVAHHRAIASIAAMREKFNIARSRVYIAGYSCGGTMALRIALAHPTLFAGAISLGGELPTGGAPLARLTECRRLRLFVATGRDSYSYPADKVCANLRLLFAAGIPVSLRQYPCGDELTTNMLADMDRWIMEQVTAPQHSADSSSSHTR